MAMKNRSCSCTGLLLMTVASRFQNSIPPGGVVSMSLPVIDTNVFGVGLSRSLHGKTRTLRIRPTASSTSLSTMRPRTNRLWLCIVA